MDSPVQVGETLAGKYKVERVLGSGAMGVVVAARHVDLQQLVAMKFMLPTALPNQAAADRFLREAQAAGRLRGEHIARVMDFGRLTGGAPYIVMEYLEGNDLENILNNHGPFSVGEAALYLSQACSAMAEAHAQGIVHRDLKPQNLFLTKRPDGSPLLKVLDFGISKLQGDVSGVTATQSTTVMGSPAYMSPEQARSAKHVDARSDIYSLGAILYQLLSGYLPFQADSVAGMLVSIVSEDPIPLSEAAPNVPVELAEIIMQCLSKDRDKRPQTARELGMLLAPFSSQRTSLWDADTERVTGKNLDAPSPKAPAQAKGPVVITTMEPSSRPNESTPKAKDALEAPRKKSSPPLVYAIIGGASLGLIVFFVAFLGRTSHDASPIQNATADTASATASAATATPPAQPATLPPASAAVVAPPETPASTAASSPPVATVAHVADKNSVQHTRVDAGAPHAPSASAHPATSATPAATGGLFDRPE